MKTTRSLVFTLNTHLVGVDVGMISEKVIFSHRLDVLIVIDERLSPHCLTTSCF
jgi:hypothetical protein